MFAIETLKISEQTLRYDKETDNKHGINVNLVLRLIVLPFHIGFIYGNVDRHLVTYISAKQETQMALRW